MKTVQFKFYSDPSHGWMAVKRKMLDELGLKFTITRYSYQKGQTVYLEEDCDAGNFIKAIREQRGLEIKIVEKSTNNRSPIRSYESYRP
jgi:hypothetical protein